MPKKEKIEKSIIRKDGRVFSVRSNRDRFFNPDEWQKFYDCLKNRHQRFTFNFLINTGARINEARNVTKEDIDWERNTIVLRETKRKKGKPQRPRIIPISKQFSSFLKKNIDNCKVLSTPASNIALENGLKKAGIKDWHMFSTHNIRKTFEIWLLSLEVDGLKVTAHLGHSMSVAARNYLSADIFSFKDKDKIRVIIGDLYMKR